jgi:hypothetical protein
MPEGFVRVAVDEDAWAAVLHYTPAWVVRPLGDAVRQKMAAASPLVAARAQRAFTLTATELDELIIWLNTVRFLAGAPSEACYRILTVLYGAQRTR